MNGNPFESQLERLARTLTDRFGVQVTCRGDQAWTDGRRIVLPSLPEPMSTPLERMTVGFLDHEMGHVAFSDFQVVSRFSKEHPGCEGLLNVVEDARIEREKRCQEDFLRRVEIYPTPCLHQDSPIPRKKRRNPHPSVASSLRPFFLKPQASSLSWAPIKTCASREIAPSR
jgi:hypothetical protein